MWEHKPFALNRRQVHIKSSAFHLTESSSTSGDASGRRKKEVPIFAIAPLSLDLLTQNTRTRLSILVLWLLQMSKHAQSSRRTVSRGLIAIVYHSRRAVRRDKSLLTFFLCASEMVFRDISNFGAGKLLHICRSLFMPFP